MKHLIEFLKKIFNRLRLPHPEEPPDYSRTLENTILDKVINQWFRDWKVSNPEFWDSVDFKLSYQYPYPENTLAETKQMWIRPEWANPGVIAHGVAHISYNLLSPRKRADFSLAFSEALKTDKLVKYLDSKNDYMNKNIIEGHAECYRYLGQYMSESLKAYYPNLL